MRIIVLLYLFASLTLTAAEPRSLPRNEGCERLTVLDFKVSKDKSLNRIVRSLPTVTALQGLINRSESTYIYLNHPPIRIFDTVEEYGDAAQFFLDAGLIPYPYQTAELDPSEDYPCLAWLLDHYGERLIGYVRAPGDVNADAGARAAALNEVTFGSGVDGDWLCYATDEVYDWMVARGYDLPVVADTRGMDQFQAFDWSWERHIDHAQRTRDLIGYGETGATPPVANDYFVACWVWVHALASQTKKDPEPAVDDRLDQLLNPAVYPMITPHLGPVEGGRIIQRLQNRDSLAFVSHPPNTSVTSSIPHAAMQAQRLEPRLRAPQEAAGVYVCFNGPDGDTVDFLPWIGCINLVEDPAFGHVPLNFRMTPFFVDTFPTLVGWASRLGNGIELQVSYNDGGPPPPGHDTARAIYGASIKRLVDMTGGAYRHFGCFGNFPGSGRNQFDMVASNDFLSIVTGYDNQGDGLMHWEEYAGIPHLAMLGQSRYPGLEEDEYEEETAARVAARIAADAVAGEPLFYMIRAPEPRGFRTLSRCAEVLAHLRADSRLGGRSVHAVPGSELVALWQTWHDGNWQPGSTPPAAPQPQLHAARPAAAFTDSVGINGGFEDDGAAAAIEDLGIRWVRTSLRDAGERARLNDLHARLGVKACALINPYYTLPDLGDCDWLSINGTRLQFEDGERAVGSYTVADNSIGDTEKGSVCALGSVDFGGGTASASLRVRVPDDQAYGWVQVWIDHYRRAQGGIVAGSTGLLDGSDNAWTTLTIDFDPAISGSHDVYVMFSPRKGLDHSAIDPWLDDLAADCGEAIGALEGPNEYDNTHPGWAAELRAWQLAFYQAAKAHADPAINTLPVIAPSVLGDPGHEELGDLSDRCDFGNMHPYTGGMHPEFKHRDKMVVNVPMVGAAPIWITEFGSHTATGYRPDRNWYFTPIGDPTTAAYVPRGYLTHFMRRYDDLPWSERAFLFRLDDKNDPTGDTDPQAHWGLLHEDRSDKPGAAALRNLLALCGTSAAPIPGALSYALDGLPEDGEHLLLQHGDGDYLLVLWRAHEDVDKRAYLDGASLADATAYAEAQAVRVHLAAPAAQWHSYRPHLSASWQRQGVAADAIDVAVDSFVTVLRIEPARDDQPPAAPTGLHGRVR